jgi:hypothetical protein
MKQSIASINTMSTNDGTTNKKNWKAYKGDGAVFLHVVDINKLHGGWQAT